MRNLFDPRNVILDLGTWTIHGQDYHHQVVQYGSTNHVHVFRKGELHKHGLVFTSNAEYEHWKHGLGRQLELFS